MAPRVLQRCPMQIVLNVQERVAGELDPAAIVDRDDGDTEVDICTFREQ